MTFRSIAFLASDSPEAREAAQTLTARHGNADPDKADCVVALGGDGLMLQALHRFVSTGIPIYGMNRGTVGFLMNDYEADGLPERLAAAPSRPQPPTSPPASAPPAASTARFTAYMTAPYS